ncbi:MAG TPA: ABC transporter substrate-binding protein [Candidatus Methylomirabilis sp.]|nr:ABC transporter substrate-binding protein [Candidatus Methylomirabilis sp.]
MIMRSRVICILLLGASLAVAAGAPVPALAQTPRPGGTLRVATIGEPPSLDTHFPTGIIAMSIGQHIFEGLFTLDKDFRPIPMLAESYSTADGGRRAIIKLRKGVQFHNGKEFSAEDAIASLQRLLKLEYHFRSFIAPNIVEIRAPDRYTVEFVLKKPSSMLLPVMSTATAFMYPKEIIDEFKEERLKKFIGTGPFEFVEWRPDRYIELKRFEKYSARTDVHNGYGGKRTAYLEKIRFIPVPDVSVRVAGIESGEYDVAEDVSPDFYTRVKGNPAINAMIIKPLAYPFIIFNKKEGLFTNKKLRQALLAALDMDPILHAAGGGKEFYALDSSIYQPDIKAWYTTAGKEHYNQKNVELAKKLAKEAGYNGQTIRWMSTKQYDWIYNTSLAAKSQLEKAGFNVDLQVLEWSTVIQRRTKPDLWDIFVTFNSLSPEPPLYQAWLAKDWPGWWENARRDELLAKFDQESDPKKRFGIWEDVQKLIWEDVPIIKIGDLNGLALASSKVKGLWPTYLMPYYNVWLEK